MKNFQILYIENLYIHYIICIYINKLHFVYLNIIIQLCTIIYYYTSFLISNNYRKVLSSSKITDDTGFNIYG